MNYQEILEKIQEEVKPLLPEGKVADYIPALSSIPAEKFGMAIRLNSGEEFSIGDVNEAFSIQSISKLITLTLCLQKDVDFLNKRVGIEPSGNPFNSLVQLEHEQGLPRNPFINAGALVTTDILMSNSFHAESEILNFCRILSENKSIVYNEDIALSEKETGFRNVALINFMKSYGNIDNDPEQVLNVYFNQCSLKMSCLELVKTFDYLSNNGKTLSGIDVVDYRNNKRINALMSTCGTYDAVGNFAFKVGLPAKSGVGGGIIATIPGKMTLAVWSPGLDAAGNSLAGGKALELFTTYTGISVY